MGANALGRVKSCALKSKPGRHQYPHFQSIPVHAERKPDDFSLRRTNAYVKAPDYDWAPDEPDMIRDQTIKQMAQGSKDPNQG